MDYSFGKKKICFFFKFYLFIHDRQREREAETQAEGEAGSMLGAQCGTRSRVSRITSRAEGSAKPLSQPGCPNTSIKKKNKPDYHKNSSSARC